jgi:hypothetical protein
MIREFALLYSYLTSPVIPQRSCPDFLNYYTGSSIIRDGKSASLYDLKTQTYYQNLLPHRSDDCHYLLFRTIPLTGMLMLPLSLINYVHAYQIFAFINIFILCFIAIIVYLESNRTLLFPLMVLSYIPLLYVILWGQMNLIILLVYIVILRLIAKKQDFYAGVLTVFMALKTHFFPVSVLLLLPISTNIKALVKGVLLALLVLIFSSIGINGITFFTEYPKFIAITEQPLYQGFTNSYYLSSQYILAKLIPESFEYATNTRLLINYVLLICVVVVLYKYRNKFTQYGLLALIPLLTQFFSYHVFISDTIFILPALGYFYIWAQEKPFYKDFSKIITFIFFILSIGISGEGSGNIFNIIFITLWMSFIIVSDLKKRSVNSTSIK